MGTISVLPPRGPDGPREEVVTLLEDLLERAKAGEIHGIAAAFTHNGAIFTTFTETDDQFTLLIGAAAVLAGRLAVGGQYDGN